MESNALERNVPYSLDFFSHLNILFTSMVYVTICKIFWWTSDFRLRPISDRSPTKTGNSNELIIDECNSRDLIGLAAMVYEPLYHARKMATVKLSSLCFCKAKSARSSNISWLRLIKHLFHPRLLDIRRRRRPVGSVGRVPCGRSWVQTPAGPPLRVFK